MTRVIFLLPFFHFWKLGLVLSAEHNIFLWKKTNLGIATLIASWGMPAHGRAEFNRPDLRVSWKNSLENIIATYLFIIKLDFLRIPVWLPIHKILFFKKGNAPTLKYYYIGPPPIAPSGIISYGSLALKYVSNVCFTLNGALQWGVGGF